MSDTLPNIPITPNTWVNLYDQSSIEVGKQLIVNNVGASDVFLVVSATEPTGEEAYIALQPRDLPYINDVGDSGLWAFSGNCEGLVNVGEYRLKTTPPKRTAFGEASVAENTHILQITAQYGLLREVLTAAIGGTATTEDSKFKVSTGTGVNNVAAIVSSREAQYKAGQGLSCRITAVFTEGQPNSTQQAGLITSESAFAFGFNGDEFGILHARDGELEQQELTITTGASANNEEASVTVDGVNFLIPISNTTAEQNAYEISTFLNTNRAGYGFTSNGNKVIALAQLPDFGAGLWDFTSDTAVASWNEIANGLIPNETWIPKDQWNVRPDINIDPTLGNVYQIQIQYLGFGGIRFYIEEPITGELVIVHIIQYANTSTRPSVTNPIFRVGWAARNNGNNTDIVVQGASGTAYIEGSINYDAVQNGASQNQTGISGTRTNVLTFRNRLTFSGKANRAEIIPQLLSLATDTNKIAVFEIIEDPVVASGDYLEFNYLDEDNSLMEASVTPAEIIGGKVVASFNVTLGGIPPIDMQKVLKYQSPNTTYSIAAFVVGTGTSAIMSASGTWQEDL